MDSSSSTNHNGTTTSGCGSHQPPRLCARGCGFFGTAENRGLCSKCHTVYLKELIAKSEAAIIGEDQQDSFQPSDQADKINDILKEVEINKLVSALNSSTLLSDQSHSNNNNPSSVSVCVGKNRCGLCKKKIGILGFECRCGATFCRMHRYPEAHSCNFDFKKAGKIAVHKDNPVCKTDKITDRV